ncbi:MAG: hypothetical protein IV107_24275 [Paucibacter sp.]|nr:hypothetical protein [Roseateles sp.]
MVAKASAQDRRVKELERSGADMQRQVSVLVDAIARVEEKGYQQDATGFDRGAADRLALGDEADAVVLLGREAREAATQAQASSKLAAKLYREQAALLRLSSPEKALAALQLAVSLAPQDHEALADAGDVALVLGDLKAAKGYYEQIARLGRTLLGSGDLESSRKLIALGSRKVGETRQLQGDLPRALESFQAAADQLELAVSHSPGDKSLRRELAQSQEQVADVLLGQALFQRAREQLQKALIIRKALAEEGREEDVIAQAIADRLRGDIELSQGEVAVGLAGRATSFESLALRNNAQFLAVLMTPHLIERQLREGKEVKFGALESARLYAKVFNNPDLDAARQSYRISMEASKRLFQNNPRARAAQSLYASSLERIAYIQAWNYDWAGVSESLKASVAIRVALMEAEPTVLRWSLAAIATYWDVGTLLAGPGSATDRVEALVKGQQLLEGLQRQGMLRGDAASWPAKFEEALTRARWEANLFDFQPQSEPKPESTIASPVPNA